MLYFVLVGFFVHASLSRRLRASGLCPLSLAAGPKPSPSHSTAPCAQSTMLTRTLLFGMPPFCYPSRPLLSPKVKN
eukprot:6487345-Amphidinium_carterae.1